MCKSSLRSVLLIVCTIVCGGILHAQQRYSVVISELMADPSPQVGLPNSEWIELHNNTSSAISLQGWRVGKPGALSGTVAAGTVLEADSNIIICTASQVAALTVFGKTVSVTSFPSLGNDGDVLLLVNNSGVTMHAVEYSSAWYKNVLKADGGYTLEMIDTRNACAGEINWMASNDAKGGTPGKTNSVKASNADATPPLLLNAFANTNSITLYFNEPVDSAGAVLPSNYNLAGNTITGVSVAAPLFTAVTLQLQSALSGNTVYTVSANGIKDCAGNSMQSQSTTVALAQRADSLNIVINEILFNPKPLGNDYIELYNNSNKAFNLKELFLANRSSTTQQIGSLTQLSSQDRLFLPSTYLVVTTNALQLQQDYTVGDLKNIIVVPSLPSYPDDKGFVVLLNAQGSIVDEVDYDDSWHFALLDNDEGVSLERIQFSGNSNDKNNWTSAASSARFGTPAAINSQANRSQAATGSISISPQVISPDNDGYDDYAIINITPGFSGAVINVTVFDAAGRPVKVLQRNATSGSSASFRWDGLNDKLQRVNPGTYIILAELYNLEGKRSKLRQTVGVAVRR